MRVRKYYRYELKYLINYHDYIILKNRLRNYMSLDPNAVEKGFYHVRSIYFDDYLNTSYYDKINGVLNRFKYRLRIYDFKDNPIKLEKKIKKGNFSTKIDFNISEEEYHLLGKKPDFLLEYHNEILNEVYLLLKYKGLRPVILIDYLREPYYYRYGKVRITFDFELHASNLVDDIFDKNINLVNVLEKNKIIMEVKYEKFIPTVIKNILQNSRINIAISKYVLCRSIFM